MIRVLIVDDSPSIRLGLRGLLESDPELNVVGEARSGEEAITLASNLRPDVITMDIVMPGMGGYEAIRRIMAESPCPIVVVTGIDSPRILEVSMKALEFGALTVLNKPNLLGPTAEEAGYIAHQVKIMSQVKVVRRTISLQSPPSMSSNYAPPASPLETNHPFFSRVWRGPVPIAIGASTGGPPALQTVLGRLPSPFPCPILIVQHMSRGFLPGLARWLETVTPFHCTVGQQGEIIRPGVVYLAPDDSHMTVRGNTIWLNASPPMGGHRPSVDALFESMARNCGANAIGVLLTGMGRDGAIGLKAMCRAGAYTIAQDESTSVVFGMPGAAVEIEAADEVLGLPVIAQRLKDLAERIREQKG